MRTSFVDLFAGPGGWDLGAARAGMFTGVGLEIDADACATARAYGHERVQADLNDLDLATHHRGVDGLMASPPCQSFSAAGLRRGRHDAVAVMDAIASLAAGADPKVTYAHLVGSCSDPRSALVVVPLVWVDILRPAWTAWEQVPAVLPLWQACAEVLRGWGYSVWAEKLHAEQHGVPQTRTRAFLGASRAREVAPPVPTHSRYHSRDPRRLDPHVAPWVSMAQALGWGMTERPSHTVTGGGTGSGGGVEVYGNYSRRVVMDREMQEGRWAWTDEDLVGFPRLDDGQDSIEVDGVAYQARDLRSGWQPAFNLTEKARSWQRWMVTSARSKATIRSGDEPAPTLTAGHDGAERRWVQADDRDGAASVAGNGWTRDGRWYERPDWAYNRPSTTVNGDRAVRVSVGEAAVLQSFPADYPWRGTRTSQFRQVGDAVPPRLAEAVLRAVRTRSGA